MDRIARFRPIRAATTTPTGANKTSGFPSPSLPHPPQSLHQKIQSPERNSSSSWLSISRWKVHFSVKRKNALIMGRLWPLLLLLVDQEQAQRVTIKAPRQCIFFCSKKNRNGIESSLMYGHIYFWTGFSSFPLFLVKYKSFFSFNFFGIGQGINNERHPFRCESERINSALRSTTVTEITTKKTTTRNRNSSPCRARWNCVTWLDWKSVKPRTLWWMSLQRIGSRWLHNGQKEREREKEGPPFFASLRMGSGARGYFLSIAIRWFKTPRSAIRHRSQGLCVQPCVT